MLLHEVDEDVVKRFWRVLRLVHQDQVASSTSCPSLKNRLNRAMKKRGCRHKLWSESIVAMSTRVVFSSLTSQSNLFLRSKIVVSTNHRAGFLKNLGKALRTPNTIFSGAMASAHISSLSHLVRARVWGNCCCRFLRVYRRWMNIINGIYIFHGTAR